MLERPRSKVWAMTFDKAVEGAVKRDRLVVVIALGFVVALSWIYVLAGAGMNLSAFETARTSSGEGSMGMMMPAVWDLDYAGLMFVNCDSPYGSRKMGRSTLQPGTT